MVEALEELGIVVEASHHEVAIGQHEIDFKYDDAMRTSDNAVTFRTTLKAIAQQHGLYATFMPKPFYRDQRQRHALPPVAVVTGMARPTSSMTRGRVPTVEQSRGRSWPGCWRTRGGMIAILAPLVNSYKRLVPGYEAPVYISWARINRSALIRIPQGDTRAAGGDAPGAAVSDPSCNPYLAFSANAGGGVGWDSAQAGAHQARRGEPVPLSTTR